MDLTQAMPDLSIRSARLWPVGTQRHRYLADTVTTL